MAMTVLEETRLTAALRQEFPDESGSDRPLRNAGLAIGRIEKLGRCLSAYAYVAAKNFGAEVRSLHPGGTSTEDALSSIARYGHLIANSAVDALSNLDIARVEREAERRLEEQRGAA